MFSFSCSPLHSLPFIFTLYPNPNISKKVEGVARDIALKAGDGFNDECAKVVNARGPIDVGGCVITSAGNIQF